MSCFGPASSPSSLLPLYPQPPLPPDLAPTIGPLSPLGRSPFFFMILEGRVPITTTSPIGWALLPSSPSGFFLFLFLYLPFGEMYLLFSEMIRAPFCRRLLPLKRFMAASPLPDRGLWWSGSSLWGPAPIFFFGAIPRAARSISGGKRPHGRSFWARPLTASRASCVFFYTRLLLISQRKSPFRRCDFAKVPFSRASEAFSKMFFCIFGVRHQSHPPPQPTTRSLF